MALIQTTTPRKRANRRHDRHSRKGWIVLGVIVAFFVVLWLIWDWNWFKGPIERRVEAATGREFSIDGNLGVDVFWPPTITADGIRLSNVPWSDDAQMLELERVEFRIEVWPLLRGDVVLPFVTLRKPRLVLERNAELAANWQFDGTPPAEDKEPMELPTIRALTIDDGELVVRESSLRTNLRLDLDSGEPSGEDALAPLLVSGEGTYRDFPFTLDGKVESPLALQDEDNPYAVSMTAKAGDTTAKASGQLYSPLQFHDFDVNFSLKGSDLADLYPLAGIALPQTPPYALDGRLQRDGLTWYYRSFTGKVGDSDLAGDVIVDTAAERPMFTAKLTSKTLDFDDLAGFLGLPPSSGEGETAAPEQAREGAALAAQDKVLPQAEYRLEKLRAMDADVTLEAAQVIAPPLPIEALSGHLTLDDGLLRLKPLNLRAAGGRVESFVSLDGSRDPIVMDSQISLVGLQLPKLFPNAELTEDSTGRIGGRFVLKGTGNSVAQMLASSNGEVGMVMGRGQISNLLLELAGLDLQEALRFLLGKDRIIPVRCAYADFGVEDGVMTARQFAFDTTDTVLYAEGQVDLGEETFELTLRPQPKDKSLVSLRSPLRVGGTFRNPSVLPKAGPLVLRGVAAAVLYSIAPPAALLALLETGPGEDSQCERPDSAGTNTGTQAPDTRPSKPDDARDSNRN